MLTEEQIERIIDSFERVATAWESIAHAAAGVNVSVQKIQRRYAPEPKTRDDAREAVVTRIPTDEDRAKENQGASDKPIAEWYSLDPEEPEEDIGPRERQFIEERRAQAERERRQSGGRPQTSGSEPGGTVEAPTDYPDV